ncbi:phosphatidylserine decarboxylase family protein [bacterium]|nr:phosphatidylserine decarboxylase family protein [bacterium]
MKISKEGTVTIVLVNIFVSMVIIFLIFFGNPVLYWLLIPLLIVEFLVVYFFRDPERNIPLAAGVIVSPADGKVVLIKDVYEDQFLKSDAVQISIFLSVFNVHVNRIPVSGTIKYFRYMRGAFLAAFNHDASVKNEQTVIGIEMGNGKLLFKQIAGLLARRIVFDPKENDSVVAGERCGIIKFGSRVDVIVQKNVDIKIKVGDKVTGGESIIGVIR